jgi:hypothetical protein
MLSLSAVPWRQNLLVMLLGLYAYETAQTLLQKKVAKGKAAAGAKQQVRAADKRGRGGLLLVCRALQRMFWIMHDSSRALLLCEAIWRHIAAHGTHCTGSSLCGVLTTATANCHVTT